MATDAPTDGPLARPRRVVIVGGGFAGLNAAHALRGSDADVSLVDTHNYHTFQPLLYQVSTGYLPAEEVGTALRSVFRRQPNLNVRVATVTAVDWDARRLALDDGATLPFDHLILAAGATTNFFGVPGMASHAWPLYTLQDAVRLREHLLNALEHLVTIDPASPVRLTVVVVGGGPTGVETAGALASMGRDVVGRRVNLRVVLVETAPRLLTAFSPRSSDEALTDLRHRGVEVRLGQAIVGADEDGVTFADGSRIDTRTVVWAAGVQASSIGGDLGLDVDHRGRIMVDPTLQVPGRPGVFAAGDLAAATHAGDPLPMLASAAIQTGRHAGEQVARLLRGAPLVELGYRDKGILAVLGRGDAVAELPLLPSRTAGHYPLRFAGLPAWLLWVGVHITYLLGFRNRIKVLVDWGWSYFTSRGSGAILLDAPQRERATRSTDRPTER